jgi:hypothetical protein
MARTGFAHQIHAFRRLAVRTGQPGHRAAGWRHELQNRAGTNYSDPVSNPVLCR